MSVSTVISVGDRYGRLVVIEEVERHIYPTGEKRRKFLMQCDCGSPPKTFLTSSFRNGTTVSCGCYNSEKSTTHGMHETRQYQCWADMKIRCDSPKNKFYSYYGGRGIGYCDKWATFEGFWEDMKDGYQDHLTLNRRDNDKSYSKDNCEWDTRCFQQHMRRKKAGTTYSVIGGAQCYSSNKIAATIKYNFIKITLGSYDTEEEVAEAYDAAADALYGDRPNKTVATRPEILARVELYLSKIGEPMTVKGVDVNTAKLAESDVLEILDLVDCGLFKQSEIGAMYGVIQASISCINRGITWKHITRGRISH